MTFVNTEGQTTAASGLLTLLHNRGIHLYAEAGRLRYRAIEGVLTDNLRQAIRQHKAGLLSLLQAGETPPDGTYSSTNPHTGQRFITYFYRCPGCNGTNWGPRVDDSGVWHCLHCADEGLN